MTPEKIGRRAALRKNSLMDNLPQSQVPYSGWPRKWVGRRAALRKNTLMDNLPQSQVPYSGWPRKCYPFQCLLSRHWTCHCSFQQSASRYWGRDLSHHCSLLLSARTFRSVWTVEEYLLLRYRCPNQRRRYREYFQRVSADIRLEC